MSWEDVESINSFPVWVRFLENPGSHREEAEQVIRKLRGRWYPGIRDATSFTLLIEEGFPFGYDFTNGRETIQRSFVDVVTNLGFESASSPDDPEILIQISGEAISAYYPERTGGSQLRTGHHYSGASIVGKLFLIDGDSKIKIGEFSGVHETPDQIYEEYNEERDAPFDLALKDAPLPLVLRSALGILMSEPPRFVSNKEASDVLFTADQQVTHNSSRKGGGTSTNLLIRDDAGILRAYADISSDPVWSYEPDGWTYEPDGYDAFGPRVLYDYDHDIVAALYPDGFLRILDTETGFLRSELEFSSCDQFVLHNGKILLGTYGEASAGAFLYAINGIEGELIWQVQLHSDIITQLLIKDDVVYIGSQDGGCWALNIEDGRMVWNQQLQEEPHQMLAMGDTLFVIAGRNRLHAMMRSDGQLLWSFKAGGQIENSYVSITDEGLYLCADDVLYALNRDDGEVQWTYRHEERKHFTSPVAADDVVFAGLFRLYAFDARTGILKWVVQPELQPTELMLFPVGDGTRPSVGIYTESGKMFVMWDEIPTVDESEELYGN